MSYFQARLAEVQIPPKKPQKYLFHVPRTIYKALQTQCLQGFPFIRMSAPQLKSLKSKKERFA